MFPKCCFPREFPFAHTTAFPSARCKSSSKKTYDRAWRGSCQRAAVGYIQRRHLGKPSYNFWVDILHNFWVDILPAEPFPMLHIKVSQPNFFIFGPTGKAKHFFLVTSHARKFMSLQHRGMHQLPSEMDLPKTPLEILLHWLAGGSTSKTSKGICTDGCLTLMMQNWNNIPRRLRFLTLILQK